MFLLRGVRISTQWIATVPQVYVCSYSVVFELVPSALRPYRRWWRRWDLRGEMAGAAGQHFPELRFLAGWCNEAWALRQNWSNLYRLGRSCIGVHTLHSAALKPTSVPWLRICDQFVLAPPWLCCQFLKTAGIFLLAQMVMANTCASQMLPGRGNAV